VFWSSEDATFVVDVPELSDCTAHGSTPAEAVLSAHDAIDLGLDTAQAMGRAVPEPKGRRLLFA